MLWEAEAKSKDAEEIPAFDAGGRGKKFEDILFKAFDLVGLKYTRNGRSGALWDIRPKGKGWQKIIHDENVNIKIANTKWMFGTAVFSKMLPWDDVTKFSDWSPELYAKRVKRHLNRLGLPSVMYLKPKDKDVQDRITAAVDKEDVPTLNDLLVRKNFTLEKLGKGYSVRITVDGNKIGSIAIDKGGKVFMRSEKPRNVSGSLMVGFRTPGKKMGKTYKRVKKQESLVSILDDARGWLEETDRDYLTELNVELAYNEYLLLCYRTHYLTVLDEVSLPAFLSDKVSFIKDLAKAAAVRLQDVARLVANKQVFKFFSAIGWSLKKLFELVKKGFKAYKDLRNLIAQYIADTKVVNWTDEQLTKLDTFLSQHPTIKKMAGPAVAGLLIYIWLNMTFTGDIVYDFDMSDMLSALAGKFALMNIFGGASGAQLLTLFATGAILKLSFPWPGPTSIKFVSGVLTGLAKLVGGRFRKSAV